MGEVIKAGATTLNIPDTVGITTPSEFGQLIADIKANTPGIENVIISTHCQNDLGLSTANTLSVCHCHFLFYSIPDELQLNHTNIVAFNKSREHVQARDKWKLQSMALVKELEMLHWRR